MSLIVICLSKSEKVMNNTTNKQRNLIVLKHLNNELVREKEKQNFENEKKMTSYKESKKNILSIPSDSICPALTCTHARTTTTRTYLNHLEFSSLHLSLSLSLFIFTFECICTHTFT